MPINVHILALFNDYCDFSSSNIKTQQKQNILKNIYVRMYFHNQYI